MSRILDAVSRLLPGRAANAPMRADVKASAVGPLIAWEPLGQPVWAPRDYAAFAREGFMQNAIVYRAVRMIAEAAASVPLLLYEGDEEVSEHPLLDLIAQPSPDQTTTDFLESWYGFLLVAGNAYVEAVALSGTLRELHVLRPDRMKVIPGPDGWPEAFEYSAAGRSVRFEAEPVTGVRPILHVRLFHPDNDHYGMSPIEAAANAIDIHNAAGGWNKALLDNAARPSGALIYAASSGNLTGEQYQRLKSELEEGYQGARNAGRPLLLEGGLDWKPLSLSPKDMDFIAAKHTAAREIALALGVPPMLLGIPGDNTYSNYQEAQRAFWRATVVPLVGRMARAFSAWLGPAYGGEVTLKADLDQVEGLSGEREALWARLNAAMFLTIDEKRAAVGYGPVEPGPVPTPDAPIDFAEAEAAPDAKRFDPNQPRVPAGNSDGGQWTDGGGGSGGSGSSSSGRVRVARANTGTLNDAGEQERFVQLAQAETNAKKPVSVREHDEKYGGHTIRYHVGRKDGELLETLRRDRLDTFTFTIARPRLGSFDSEESANDLVNRTLADFEDEIESVASGRVPKATLKKRFGSITGKEAFRPDAFADPYMRPTYSVKVVIETDKRSPTGYRVLTAFPFNPIPGELDK